VPRPVSGRERKTFRTKVNAQGHYSFRSASIPARSKVMVERAGDGNPREAQTN
jgi:hypothetical protein